MDLTIERAPLLATLTRLAKVVDRKIPLPILDNVLIEASGDTVTLRTTNLDIEEVSILPTVGGRAIGMTTVAVASLRNLVKSAPKGCLVRLTAPPDADLPGLLVVTAGAISASLPTLPRSDFPTMAEAPCPTTFACPAPALLRLFGQAQHAVSTEGAHYYLKGVYFHATTGEGGPVLRAVATDGHRLARIDAALPDGAADMPGVIVPAETVKLLLAALKGAGDVVVAVSETKVRFATPEMTLTSKVIDGTFPDYPRVIPQGNTRRLEVDAAGFAGAVNRVATVATSKARPVTLHLDPAEGQVRLVCAGEGGLTAEAAVPAAYNGEAMTIGFNFRYLLDTLAQVEGVVAVSFGDSGDPGRVQAGNDDSAVYVIMPMRV